MSRQKQIVSSTITSSSHIDRIHREYDLTQFILSIYIKLLYTELQSAPELMHRFF